MSAVRQSFRQRRATSLGKYVQTPGPAEKGQIICRRPSFALDKLASCLVSPKTNSLSPAQRQVHAGMRFQAARAKRRTHLVLPNNSACPNEQEKADRQSRPGAAPFAAKYRGSRSQLQQASWFGALLALSLWHGLLPNLARLRKPNSPSFAPTIQERLWLTC
jgi:hypothetical protein